MGDSTTVPTNADAVRILCAGHEGDEGFVPYTNDTLAARLDRAPYLYGPIELARHTSGPCRSTQPPERGTYVDALAF